MTTFDLHAHSTASDGLLRPSELVRRAAERGVRTLALTDHDEISGLQEAAAAAEEVGLTLVNGTEISVTWREQTVHVVGLRVDSACPMLCQGLASVRGGRDARAHRIAESLARAGVPGAYEGALKHATSERLISRTHFARDLVERGVVRSMKDVFRRFLSPGKPGYVPHRWAELSDAVEWIHAAGGQAVLAHPGRYPVSKTAMRQLLEEFKSIGGDAIEVFTSSHTRDHAVAFAEHARHFGLLASAGSDYHGPGESWLDLGALPPLPADLVPVWKGW